MEKLSYAEAFKLVPLTAIVYFETSQGIQFVIKEKEEDLKKMKIREVDTLAALTTWGIFEIGIVYPIVVMFDIQDVLYEAWWNYHMEWGGKKIFHAMANQPEFNLIFTNEHNEQVQSFLLGNIMQIPFRRYSELLHESIYWTPEDFESARSQIHDAYPTPEILYGKLATNNGNEKEIGLEEE